MLRRITFAGIAVTLMMALVPIAAHASDGGGGSDDDQFRGVIERLPSTAPIGDWLVSGTTVHVSAATEIDEDGNAIAVGATVEVEGTVGTDGSITATKVQIEEGADDDASASDPCSSSRSRVHGAGVWMVSSSHRETNQTR